MSRTTITLNNDLEMPAIGLGVFQTPPELTTDAVAEALLVGYRLIDTYLRRPRSSDYEIEGLGDIQRSD